MFFPPIGFAFFIREWREDRLYLASLNMQEKKERIREKLYYCVSFTLHIIFFLSAFYGVFNNILSGDAEHTIFPRDSVDFELTEGMISGDLSPMYDKKSDIIIQPSALLIEKKKQEKQKLSLNTLLQKLKASKNTGLSSPLSKEFISKDVSNRPSKLNKMEKNFLAGLGLSGKKNPAKKSISLQKKLWDHINLQQSNKKSGNINYAHIMSVIDQNSAPFRDCYEEALLKNEQLSVKATFILILNGSKVKKAKLDLNGNGHPKIHRTLSYCLFQESKKLIFLKNTENISFKFNLIFGL